MVESKTPVPMEPIKTPPVDDSSAILKPVQSPTSPDSTPVVSSGASMDSNTKEQSDIVTLEPYSAQETEKAKAKDKRSEEQNSKNRKRKYRVNPTLIHFDSLFGSDSWSRFLIFKTETELTAAKFENLLLSKCPTREMSFRPMNRKEWLVETTTRNQSETYQSLNSFNGISNNNHLILLME